MKFKLILRALGAYIFSALWVLIVIEFSKKLVGFGVSDTPFIPILVIWLCLVIYSIFSTKKYIHTGGRGGLAIFTNYRDMFECLIVLAGFILLFDQEIIEAKYKPLVVLVVILFGLGTTIKSIQINDQIGDLKLITFTIPILLFVKFTMSILWVYSFIQPASKKVIKDGKTNNRKRNRKNNKPAKPKTKITPLFFFLTPMINSLVLGIRGEHIIERKMENNRFIKKDKVEDNVEKDDSESK